MLFSDHPRTHYPSAPVHEVICQLRFPTILTINNVEPADFQEIIRDTFPQYARRQDMPAPQPLPAGAAGMPKPVPVTNYHFLSADNHWKLNLTKDFIALSTIRYTGWEEFAHHLDKALAAFIQTYKPAYFERVGLRYLNFISRNALNLSNTPFRELITPAYLGLLTDDDVNDSMVTMSNLNTEVNIRGGCKVKIHTGPGLVKKNGQGDNEIRFIFDQDLYMPGKVPVNMSAGALQTLHSQAWAIFRGAITDTLHEAMNPNSV